MMHANPCSILDHLALMDHHLAAGPPSGHFYCNCLLAGLPFYGMPTAEATIQSAKLPAAKENEVKI